MTLRQETTHAVGIAETHGRTHTSSGTHSQAGLPPRPPHNACATPKLQVKGRVGWKMEQWAQDKGPVHRGKESSYEAQNTNPEEAAARPLSICTSWKELAFCLEGLVKSVINLPSDPEWIISLSWAPLWWQRATTQSRNIRTAHSIGSYPLSHILSPLGFPPWPLCKGQVLVYFDHKCYLKFLRHGHGMPGQPILSIWNWKCLSNCPFLSIPHTHCHFHRLNSVISLLDCGITSRMAFLPPSSLSPINSLRKHPEGYFWNRNLLL